MYYLYYRYCLIFVALVACGSSEPVPPALGHYLSAQEALAADDFARAREALQNLVQHAAPTLVPLGEKAVHATDITAMRAA